MSRNNYDDMPTRYDRRGRRGKKTGIIASLCVIVTLLIIVLFLLFSPEPEVEEITIPQQSSAPEEITETEVIEVPELPIVDEPPIAEAEPAVIDVPVIEEIIPEPVEMALPETPLAVEETLEDVVEAPVDLGFIIYGEIDYEGYSGSINAGPESATIDFPLDVIDRDILQEAYSAYLPGISFEHLDDGRIILAYPKLDESKGYALASFSEELFKGFIDQIPEPVAEEIPQYTIYDITVAGYDIRIEAGKDSAIFEYPVDLCSISEFAEALDSAASLSGVKYEYRGDQEFVFRYPELSEDEVSAMILASEKELNDFFNPPAPVEEEKPILIIKRPGSEKPVAEAVQEKPIVKIEPPVIKKVEATPEEEKKEVILYGDIDYLGLKVSVEAGETKAFVSFSGLDNLEPVVEAIKNGLTKSGYSLVDNAYKITDDGKLEITYPELSLDARREALAHAEASIKEYLEEINKPAPILIIRRPEPVTPNPVVEPEVMEEEIVAPEPIPEEPEVFVNGTMKIFGNDVTVEAGETSARVTYPEELITTAELLEAYEFVYSKYANYLDYLAFDISTPGIIDITYPELSLDARREALAHAEASIKEYIDEINKPAPVLIIRRPEPVTPNPVVEPEVMEEEIVAPEPIPEEPEVFVNGTMKIFGNDVTVEAGETSARVTYPEELITTAELLKAYEFVYSKYANYLDYLVFDISTPGIIDITYPELSVEFRKSVLAVAENEINEYLNYAAKELDMKSDVEEQEAPAEPAKPEVLISGSMEYMGHTISVNADNHSATFRYPSDVIGEKDIEAFISSSYSKYGKYLSTMSYRIIEPGVLRVSYPYTEGDYIISALKIAEDEVIRYVDSIFMDMEDPEEELGIPRFTLPLKGYAVSSSVDGMVVRGTPGDRVVAPLSGVVVEAGRSKDKGKFIVIDHGLGLKSAYYGLEEFDVANGEEVKENQTLGSVGKKSMIGDSSILIIVEVDNEMINPIELM